LRVTHGVNIFFLQHSTAIINTMPPGRAANLSSVPAVDRVLREPAAVAMMAAFGRSATVDAVRAVIDQIRNRLIEDKKALAAPEVAAVAAEAAALLEHSFAPSLRPVFNLTGTVLHTNLGRAVLPEEAIVAVIEASRGASNLEYDVETGRRGDRDSHVETLLCRLTGAEAATLVNNNAAAVLLVLNTLAQRKEVPVSRGELIEIGGAFRMPDIMARAGCKLIEIGTTNRTHIGDYAAAIGRRTGMLMKVHRSNFAIQGFTAEVSEPELAKLAHKHEIPFAIDLGSGTLVNLKRYGLPHEPTPADTLAQGADLVTFSTDKLLGGPQGGVIVGRADLIAELKCNPLKRAMRCDKMTIAALAAVLRLYRDPDRLAERLPTLRHLSRTTTDITAVAARLQPIVAEFLDGLADVFVVPCRSQMGSGSMPVERLESAALAIRPAKGKGSGAALKRLEKAMRTLPIPVIGRIADDAILLDLRCLDDENGFVSQLSEFRPNA
jgi:L-seryl-tRNA(Ser) seleniumtransferase